MGIASLTPSPNAQPSSSVHRTNRLPWWCHPVPCRVHERPDPFHHPQRQGPSPREARKQLSGKKGKRHFLHSVTGVLCESYGHLYGLHEDGQYDGVVFLASAAEAEDGDELICGRYD